MSNASRRIADHQSVFVRDANILRKNLYEWDQVLRDPRGEDWPSMLGRLNAAMNQINHLDASIDDVMNHFVYEPRKATANPQDIPLFLSVRLVDDSQPVEQQQEQDVEDDGDVAQRKMNNTEEEIRNPAELLTQYEKKAADLANNFAETMIRY